MSEQSMVELRAYAKSIDVIPMQYENRESLQARINAKLATNQAASETPTMFGKVVKPVAPAATFATQDELFEALAPFIDKGVQIAVDESTKSWIARYKGAEDSGSLSIPLHVIKRLIADGVARGARFLPKIKGGELDGAFGA